MIEITMRLFTAEEVTRLGAFMQTLEEARTAHGLQVGNEMTIPIPVAAPSPLDVAYGPGTEAILGGSAVSSIAVAAHGIQDAFAAAGLTPATQGVPAADKPNQADLEAAVRSHMAREGLPATRALLNEFGVARIGDVQAEQKAKFYMRLL